MSDLKTAITEATTAAMKARDKERVATLRMVNAELKRVEVDERKALVDADVIAILNKMLKQRHDARQQFADAGRQELADKEAAEIDVIQGFLPAQLSAAETDALVAQCVNETGASGMQDMGKVMGTASKQLAGQADGKEMSSIVKKLLA